MERKHTHFDWQFIVTLEDSKGHLLESHWGGIDFGNSWKAACNHAKEWTIGLAANGEVYQARVHDRMKRKQDLIIKP